MRFHLRITAFVDLMTAIIFSTGYRAGVVLGFQSCPQNVLEMFRDDDSAYNFLSMKEVGFLFKKYINEQSITINQE